MSKTEVKNGGMVWDALCDAVRELPPMHDGWVTVGEVLRKSSKTRPTVRKYLRAAADAGFLRRFVDRHGMELYKLVQEG